MSNGEHQLFTGNKQVFRPFISFFQLPAVTIAAGYVTHYQNQEKDREQHCSDSYSTNGACWTHSYLLLHFCILAGTQGHFLLVLFYQAIHSCCQLRIHTLIFCTSPPDCFSPLQPFFLCSHTNLLLKGIFRSGRFQNSIRSNLHGGINKHGTVLFSWDKHFCQSLKETFLLRRSQ